MVNSLMSRDYFGEQFRMKLDAGNQSLPSIFGSVMSIFITIVIILFTCLKADVLIQKKDVDILSTIYDRYFTNEDVFNYENGFNVAAAFTKFNSDTEFILDPKYGELVFQHYFWGLQQDGKYRSGRERVKSMHNCTREELGLDGDKSKAKFKPSYVDNTDLVNTYQKKFTCIDEEDAFIFGDYNSVSANLINIQLVKCNNVTQPGVECKSDEEILNFFRGKYILLLYNENRFNSQFYG